VIGNSYKLIGHSEYVLLTKVSEFKKTKKNNLNPLK